VRPAEVVEDPPFLELLVQEACVGHDALPEPIELLYVDAVGSLYLSGRPGRGRADVDVPDASVE